MLNPSKKRKNKLKNNLLLLLLTFHVFIQAQQNIEVINEDLDGDGSTEELIIYNYLGAIDYAILSYQQGSKRCTLDISPNIDYPSLLNIVPVCDELLSPENKKLRHAIEQYIFKMPEVKNPCPSFSWLLNIYETKEKVENSKYFNSIAWFKPNLQEKLFEMPSSSRFEVRGNLLNKINIQFNKADSIKSSWITFNGEALNKARQISKFKLESDWPQLVDSLNQKNIYKTGHSVYLQSDSSHQVIFVTDGVSYQNIQKISWESIQQVGVYKKKILILTHPYPAIENKLFLIDLNNNSVLEFKKEALLDYENSFRFIESFEVIEDELFLFLKTSPSATEVKEKSIPFILINKNASQLTPSKK